MSPHITILPASTQAGQETIRALLESDTKPTIRAIYRHPAKAPADFTENLKFQAVKGDVSTGEGLDFSLSNAVFYIPPPAFDGTDQGEFATTAASNVHEALKKAPQVNKLVVHSAPGAQFEDGIGILRINHITDRMLKSAAPEVLIVKPGWYFTVFAGSLESMQADEPSFDTPFWPEDHRVPMVSIRDIAAYVANALLDLSAQPGLRSVQLFGPREYSALEVKEAVEAAVGKRAKMKVIEKDQLAAWFEQHHVPKKYSQEYADLVIASNPGGRIVPEYDDPNAVRGKTELADGLRQMLSA